MYLADTKDGREEVQITDELRSTHMHVLGASGTGKSKLLEHMIREDIKAGKGLCLIDPHGTLYDKIVTWCALNGRDEFQTIHLFEPTAEGWAFGFNPLQCDISSRRNIDFSIDAVVRVFAQVWGGEDQQKTPLLKRCLKLTLFALVHHNLTLLEARKITSASDVSGLRRLLTANLGDDIFDDEWEDMNAHRQREFNADFSSTNNRLFDFLTSQVIAHTIGQQEKVLDVAGIMERGEILLVDLSSRGTNFTRSDSSLIGALLVNDLLLKARDRKEKSRPFYLYIDECYRYLTDDIEDVLFEGRKFGLHLILSHQDLSQLGLPESTMHNAVMSGAQSKVVFKIGIRDAGRFAEEFEVDLQEAKTKFKTYQTTGTEIIELESESVSKGVSTTESWAETESTTESFAESHGASKSFSEAQNMATSEGDTRGSSRGENTQDGRGRTRQERTDPVEIFFRGKQVDPYIETVSDTKGTGKSSGQSNSQSRSSSKGRSTSHGSAESHSTTRGSSTTHSTTHGISETHSVSHTKGRSQALRPIIEETYMQGYTLEEQRYRIAVEIRKQDQRHAIFITPQATKVSVVVPETRNIPLFDELEEEIESFKLRAFQNSHFVSTTEDVVQEIEARRARLLPPDSPEERENW